MRRPWTVAALALTLLGASPGRAAGGTATLDVVTYTPPEGWTPDTSSATMRKYTLVEGTSFCVIAVYASVPGSGDARRDFEQEWQDVVVKSLRPQDAPRTETGATQGPWRNVNGAAGYTRDGAQEFAVLSTFSASPQNRRASILLVGNDPDCVPHLEALLGTVTLATPVAAAPPARNAPAPAAPPAPPPTAATGGPYAYTTTTFDDGWTATPTADWVEVRNGPVTFRLHYDVPYTDATRTLDEVARVEFFWNALIASRYRAANLTVTPGELGVGRTYYGEADATDLATGQRVHVALHLTSANGQARVTEIVTPDRATLRATFPTLEVMADLRRYNRFGVAPSDLRGTWENSSSAYGMYYSSVTGAFAGMRGASTYDRFDFTPDGRYTYHYVGVSSGAGSPAVSQGTTTGTLRGGPWEFTATDTTGKQTTYLAQFEAIRGGRILHLQDKQFSALQYHLVRTR